MALSIATLRLLGRIEETIDYVIGSLPPSPNVHVIVAEFRSILTEVEEYANESVDDLFKIASDLIQMTIEKHQLNNLFVINLETVSRL